MPQRPKYPLTPEAKEAAKALVKAWNSGKLSQQFQFRQQQNLGDTQAGMALFNGYRLLPETILELSYFGLLTPTTPTHYLLLQELRNAVNSDFEVSDYFLTMNAVGTIVYGNLEVKEGALFQSVATNEGSIIQNTGQLVDQLEELLGNEVLSQNPELHNAIVNLRALPDDQPTRKQKLGLVVQELGRSLGHMSNTAGAIQAISLILKFFG